MYAFACGEYIEWEETKNRKWIIGVSVLKKKKKRAVKEKSAKEIK